MPSNKSQPGEENSLDQRAAAGKQQEEVVKGKQEEAVKLSPLGSGWTGWMAGAAQGRLRPGGT